MKTLVIVDLITWGLIAFLKWGPNLIIWLAVWPARRRRDQARAEAEKVKLDLAIARANLKAHQRHQKKKN